ncbi:proteasome-type protease [Pararhodospirillum oryzae]|uniref:Peptidase n=1 Tax=Pararhodospirillum oryzae TaxID=478448 RepID=A0A512H7Z6_9PROT|nr:proteasome-type protease [Pararhodospirillum oryzae]GEO81564.1 peptidase [Pararhodospirillum oryzae]
MTYCLGILLEDGLVMMADTRTNAGVDNVATFRKLRVWERPGERVIVLLSAGNLAITQSVVALLEDSVRWEEHEEMAPGPHGRLMSVPGLTAAARAVGEAVRAVHRRDAAALREQGNDFVCSFLLGGQVAGGPMRLFMIYAAGNFIEAGEDTPFLQIGETKYGKPILDRVVNHETSLAQAAKCALVSFDSTMRSNLSVGPPIDLLIYRRDTLGAPIRRRFQADDPYLLGVRDLWGEGVRQLFLDLPDLPFAPDVTPPLLGAPSPMDTDPLDEE